MNYIKLTRAEYTDLSPKDPSTYYLIKNEGKVYLGETQIWKEFIDYSIPLCFTANTAGSTIELTAGRSPSIANTAYSLDGLTWTTFTPSTTSGTNVITLANVGDKVYFRNDITDNFTNYDYLHFVMSGSIAASGNCNSMYSVTNFTTLKTLTYEYCYINLFQNCTSLTTSPLLPATTLSKRCYISMFAGCTNLISAPVMPANIITSHGSCSKMFNLCQSLTNVPLLSFVNIADYCCERMFNKCSALTNVPPIITGDIGLYGCNQMFAYCTALTISPSIQANSIGNYGCQGMFGGCTSLTTLSSISAQTTIGERACVTICVACTSITSAVSISAQTMGAYACEWAFYNCSTLTTAPSLPCMNLSNNCYYNMFQGCSSLTTPPALPATTLANWCYYGMFKFCASLQVNDAPVPGVAEQAWTIPTNGTFANTYKQYFMFTSCAGTRSSNDMPGEQGQSYTYYTQNTPIGG